MIRLERLDEGRTLAVHEWRPHRERPVWFLLLLAALAGIPAFLGGWEVGAAMALLVCYPLAAQCFNDRFVLVDRQQIQWWDRPFPLQRRRKLPVEDVVEWAYGVTPKGKRSMIAQYSVGVVRRNGKILQAIRGEDELNQAQNCAEVLARATGKKAIRRALMQGAREVREQWWRVGIALAVAALAIAWILWQEI